MLEDCLLLILVLILSVTSEQPQGHLLSDEYIEYINNVQSLWQAGRNFAPDTPMQSLRTLTGVLDAGIPSQLEEKHFDEEQLQDLPESFDARKHWPNCTSLSEIRDQSGCGSCWAVSAVEVMTDRFCISSDGVQQFHFSAMDLLTCCNRCTLPGLICSFGGLPDEGWKYWVESGIVSGGNYDSKEKGCRPYLYPKCTVDGSHGLPVCKKEDDEPCEDECVSPNLDYDKDKHFGKNHYKVPLDENAIKAEILNHGPVQATFRVNNDFYTYKSGVYRTVYQSEGRGHAVKIIGWGVENNTKYWLVANSWNEFWGDNGYFKIVRGENHCGIEEGVRAGEPVLKV